MKRQSNIEIYVRSTSQPHLLSWIKTVFRDVMIRDTLDNYTFLDGTFDGHVIHITLQSNMAGGAYTSIWFNSPHAPWATDADCARQAAKALGVEVRCDPGNLSDFPSHFLSISDNKEVLVDWDRELDKDDKE